VGEVPIEDRHGDEVRVVAGLGGDGVVASVRLLPADQAVRNPAFDVTPAEYVTGFVTERGLFAPSELEGVWLGLSRGGRS
jgi:methylthioribose-1-phosphate isomerase